MARGLVITVPTCLLLSMASAGAHGAQTEERVMSGESTMVVIRKAARPSGPGPEQFFTGSVRVEPLFPTHDPQSRMSW